MTGPEGDFADFYAATWPRTLAVVYALTGDRGAGEEVARIEHCPAGTIKARLSRGRAALAPLLSDHQVDEPNGAPTHV